MTEYTFKSNERKIRTNDSSWTSKEKKKLMASARSEAKKTSREVAIKSGSAIKEQLKQIKKSARKAAKKGKKGARPTFGMKTKSQFMQGAKRNLYGGLNVEALY